MERGGFGIIDAREAFPPALKREVREEQGNCCAMCGGTSKKRELEVHHKIPESRNGPDTLANAVGLCENDHLIANRMFLQYGITYESLIQFLHGEIKT